MTFLADLHASGIWPLRHHEKDYDPGRRHVRRACAVARDDKERGMFEVHETYGDVVGAFMWDYERDVSLREEPGWAWSWAAITTKARSDVPSPKTRARGTKAPTRFGMRPLKNADLEADEQFVELEPVLPSFAAPLLKGWTSTVGAGSEIDSQETTTLPAFLGLVCPNIGDGSFGTTVIEQKVVNGDHEPDFQARVQSAWRVVQPRGNRWSSTASDDCLAWQLGRSSDSKALAGFGLCHDSGVTAAASHRLSGPLQADGACPHVIGTDASGNSIFSLHLSDNALIKGISGDAPIQWGEWVKPRAGLFLVPATFAVDLESSHSYVDGQVAGMRRIETQSFFTVITGDPEDSEQPPVTKDPDGPPRQPPKRPPPTGKPDTPPPPTGRIFGLPLPKDAEPKKPKVGAGSGGGFGRVGGFGPTPKPQPGRAGGGGRGGGFGGRGTPHSGGANRGGGNVGSGAGFSDSEFGATRRGENIHDSGHKKRPKGTFGSGVKHGGRTDKQLQGDKDRIERLIGGGTLSPLAESSLEQELEEIEREQSKRQKLLDDIKKRKRGDPDTGYAKFVGDVGPVQLAMSPLVFGLGGIKAFPQHHGDGKPDLRNPRPDIADDLIAGWSDLNKRPVTASLVGFGKHSGCDWDYTQDPGGDVGASPTGTAPGGFVMLPPEVVFETQTDSSITKSRTSFILCGVELGFGCADAETGTPVAGYVIEKTSVGDFTINTVDNAGAKTVGYKMENDLNHTFSGGDVIVSNTLTTGTLAVSDHTTLDGNLFVKSESGTTTQFDTQNATSPRVLTTPDASGTIALTSDIPSVPSDLTWGNGADGALSVTSGTTTLGGPKHYSSVSVTGGELELAGYRITCSGLFNIGASGTVSQDGANGASGLSGGSGGVGWAGTMIGPSETGGLGGTGAGSAGTAANISVGSAGGAGGAGTAGAGGGGGAVTNSRADYIRALPNAIDLINTNPTGTYGAQLRGGAGGGGGSGDSSSGGGGGGGAGGGIALIVAKTFANAGTLSAQGGPGGAGENANSGGGGGGGGGRIIVISSTTTASRGAGNYDISGGTGGAAGGEAGDGVAGSNGTDGTLTQLEHG